MAAITPGLENQYVENKLLASGLNHLKVTKRGENIIIYAEDKYGKSNRCRFIYIKANFYNLNMANHLGRWEPTPFQGALDELLEMVIEQFPWTLANYE